MQTKKDDNAFPQTKFNELGLTKLEYFAGKALQGILANNELTNNENYSPSDNAVLAIEAAKLLIYQLNKEASNDQQTFFKD
jgi:hypothetical protein